MVPFLNTSPSVVAVLPLTKRVHALDIRLVRTCYPLPQGERQSLRHSLIHRNPEFGAQGRRMFTSPLVGEDTKAGRAK